LNTEWRALSSCVEYDLSLRKRQLGDVGVKRLVNLLERKEYATHEWDGRLRVLNLERQGITRQGAGYIARWLSIDPVETDESISNNLVDIDRIPSAVFRSIYINLEGNPIGLLGVKDLERAVDKARVNGIKVVIVGGGSSSDTNMKMIGNTGQYGVGHQHVVKLGPIEYTRKSMEMPPWRLPIHWHVKVRARLKSNAVLPSLALVAVFGIGVVIGRVTYGKNLCPYRLAIVHTSDG
jgi:hypothetical protein